MKNIDTGAEIRQALERAFDVQEIEIIDESESHRGHAGYREGGQTHFRLRLRAPELGPMSRVQRHRAVHAAIGPDILGRVHALALDLEG